MVALAPIKLGTLLRRHYAIALIALLSQCQPTPPNTYRVDRVSDGDTITIVGNDGENLSVRFACVDAPEIAHTKAEKDRPTQRQRNHFQWGDRAKDRLTRLINDGGDRVRLTITTSDQYGRAVAEVWLPDGRLAQEVLAREGLVMAFRRYYKDCPSASLIDQAESTAQQSKLGVWGDAWFVPPWEFRRD